MKNSLFKRVLATVSAVPLALSQCLTFSSYAVTNDSVQSTAENAGSSEKEAYTLKDNFLYIAPGQVESTWYSAFNAELVAIGNRNPVGYVKKETISNAILRRAGKYTEKAKLVLEMLSEEDIKYVVSTSGDVTITGKIVNPDLSALMDASKLFSIDDATKALAEKYGAPEIATADFSTVDFSGTYEIVIEGSDLADGNKFDVKAKYTANTPVNGKTVFAAGDAVDFALAKYDEIMSIAYAAIDSANLPADKAAEAKAEFNAKFSKYQRWINRAKNMQDKVYTVKRTKSSPDMKSLIETINNYLDNGKYSNQVDKVEDKVNREFNIPATVTDIMNNSYIAPIYEAVLKRINKASVLYDVQITGDDIAAFADNELSNLTATAASGTYTLTGDFPDDEIADSVKHMVATVQAGDIYDADGTLATLGLKIYREPVTTTSTESTTTTDTVTTTTTTTTDTDTDSTTTTTTTTTTVISGSDTGTDTVTTTTVSGSGSGTGTDSTTTTTESGSGTGTGSTTTTSTASGSDTGTGSTTTTTESGSGTGTGSTTTTASGSGSGTGTDSTTTTTESGSGTGTGSTTTTSTASGSDTGTDTGSTTTTASGSDTGTGTSTTTTGSGIVLNGEVETWHVSVETSGYGFYYNNEESFRKEQVEKIVLHIIYVGGETEDMDVDFEFASTPSETFVRYDKDFKYDAALNYAGETISDVTGKTVLASGDALKTVLGENASTEVYIGYMGDANLDYNVDAIDATQIQVYYAELSTGGTADSVILSLTNSELVTSPDSVYDKFAAFLGDVNQSDGAVEENWRAEKSARIIDAVDASCVLSCYAYLSTNEGEIGTQEVWDKVFAD